MILNLEANPIAELGIRVRSILGVPEVVLTDTIISSPVFITKAEKFINKNIKEYETLDKDLIEIATIYYICYLICPGMYSRLPKRMENLSTKTLLQDIDWDKMALEMLEKSIETLEEAIALETDEDINYSVTFAKLSASSEYPNPNV